MENGLVYACILAAGKGKRMNMEVNKQYYPIRGIPILSKTLMVFDRANIVNGIILVVNQSDIDYCKEHIVNRYGIRKVVKIVAGGKERQESSYKGIANVPSDADIIMIHDGARPFVTENIINDAVAGAREYGASCVCVPTRDTIKVSDVNGFISQTPNRKNIYMAQTPQCFKRDLILNALEEAMSDNKTYKLDMATDDSQLVEALGYRVKIVTGSYSNIKITTKEDLYLAEIISSKMEY